VNNSHRTDIFPLSTLCIAAFLHSVEAAAVNEIVVTARKKQENLQKVPIAIDVLGSEQIQELAIRDLDDVMRFSPSLIFDESFNPQDTKITVRGVPNTRGRSNVAFLIDGIDVTSQPIGSAGSSILVNQRLLDVERIEVVKGPQSALYGRSAFAGALSYVSKEPGDRDTFVDTVELCDRRKKLGLKGAETLHDIRRQL
jgi:outer membrane receptor protein involved in Fe transport